MVLDPAAVSEDDVGADEHGVTQHAARADARPGHHVTVMPDARVFSDLGRLGDGGRTGSRGCGSTAGGGAQSQGGQG